MTDKTVVNRRRRARLVLLIWAAAIVILALQAIGIDKNLDDITFRIDGSRSASEQDAVRHYFGDGIEVPILLQGPDDQVRAQGAQLAAALSALPRTKVVTPWQPGSPATVLQPNPGTAMLVATVEEPDSQALDVGRSIRSTVAAQVREPVRASVTGAAAINLALTDETVNQLTRGELIALPILLVVLLMVFRSVVATAIPAGFGFASVLGGFGILGLLAKPLHIDAGALSLASMMGLALGVDYSLLIVSRFRTELATGVTPQVAAHRTVRTSGRTVIFASCVLLAAMGAILLTSPGPFVTSATTGVAIVTVVAAISAVLVIPRLLELLGDRVNAWPVRLRRSRDAGETAGRRWLELSMRRPVAVVLVIVAGLLAIGGPTLGIHVRTPGVDILPQSDPARVDFERISTAMGPGWGGPLEVLVAAPEGSLVTSQRAAQLTDLEHRISTDPDVATVLGPGALLGLLSSSKTGTPAASALPPGAAMVLNVDHGSTAGRLMVIPKSAPGSPESAALGERLRDAADDAARTTGLVVMAGGQNQTATDFGDAILELLPWLILAICAITCVILMVVLRSVLIPLLAVGLNLLTVAAAFGVLQLLFGGHPALFGGPGYLDATAVLLIFAITFGLSIDYQVFLLDRFREEWLVTGDPNATIHRGLSSTARIITGAALIMTGVFLGFSLTDFVSNQQRGIGLMVAVLLDATVIRLILFPALLTLCGRAAWWFPGRRTATATATPIIPVLESEKEEVAS